MIDIKDFRVLELFAGTRSIGKAFQRAGVPRTNIISIEINTIHDDIDIYDDVYLHLDLNFLRSFNFIWASPDCTTYSFASTTVLHRIRNGNYTPISEYAKQCDSNNVKLFKALMDSRVPFMVENPRAMLRFMPFIQFFLDIGLGIYTFYYGGFDTQMYKPTNIFSNLNLSFIAACAPNGTKKVGSFVEYKNKVMRSVIPDLFCDYLVKYILKQDYVYNASSKIEQLNIFSFGVLDTDCTSVNDNGSSKPCVARSNRVGDAIFL